LIRNRLCCLHKGFSNLQSYVYSLGTEYVKKDGKFLALGYVFEVEVEGPH